MFASARRWLRTNRTPLAVAAGVVGAGYVAVQYCLARLNDARERMSSDRIARDNLRRRFDQNQEDCTFTVLALLPTATANILAVLNTEHITYEIQQLRGPAAARRTPTSPPSLADTAVSEEDGKSIRSSRSDGDTRKSAKTKRQLWDDLTISVGASSAFRSAVTRAFTLIYTLALLTIFTRLQLNLLGRRSYLSSVVTLATGAPQAAISLENKDDDNPDQDYGRDFDINRRYLAFSWWLLNKGCLELMHRVESAVRTVFGTLSPRDLLSFQRLADLTMDVRRLVEGSTPEERRASDWLRFLLPPRDQEEEVIVESGILQDDAAAAVAAAAADSPQPSPAALRLLLDETADLIESPAFSHVLTLILDAAFSLLVDKKLAAEAFGLPVAQGSAFGQREPVDGASSEAVLLPKILSVLTRQAHVIGDGNGAPHEYLEAVESVGELEALAAVVYSSNWENELRDRDGFGDGLTCPDDKDGRCSRLDQVDFEKAWVKAVDETVP